MFTCLFEAEHDLSSLAFHAEKSNDVEAEQARGVSLSRVPLVVSSTRVVTSPDRPSVLL